MQTATPAKRRRVGDAEPSRSHGVGGGGGSHTTAAASAAAAATAARSNEKTITIVDPNYHKNSKDEEYGFPLCNVQGQSASVVVKYFEWPVPCYACVVKGMRFRCVFDDSATGTVEFGKHRGTRQLHATSVEVVDIASHMTVIHLVTALPWVIDHAPRMLGETAKTTGGLYGKFEEVIAGKAPPAELGIPKNKRPRVIEEYRKRRGAIRLCVKFPCIPPKAAIKLCPTVTVDRVRENPWCLSWPKHRLAGKRMLYVSDTIARQYLTGGAPAANDPRRIAAYVRAAVCDLRDVERLYESQPTLSNAHAKSTWFPGPAIVEHTMRLLEEGAHDWPFDRETVQALVESAPNTVLARDTTACKAEVEAEQERSSPLYTIPEVDLTERSIAETLAGISNASTTNVNARQVLGLLKLYRMAQSSSAGTAASGASSDDGARALEKKLDKLVPFGWRSVYKRMAKADDVQIGALDTLLSKRVLALVGHAGVGKSCTLALVVVFMRCVLGVEMACVAPTGKARARLESLLGDAYPVRTVHSQIACANTAIKAFVVDESSMVDNGLFERLLDSTEEELEYLVLAGDDHQLPSIGPGSLLRDVLGSGVVATVRLTKIYRQGDGSAIAKNSPSIAPDAPRRLAPVERTGDFALTLCGGREETEKTQQLQMAIRQFRTFREQYGESTVMIANTNAVCDQANVLLQNICNPQRAGEPQLERKKRAPWREHDRVVNHENQDANLTKDMKIFNGQLGRIESIDASDNTFVAAFDDGSGRTARHTYTCGSKQVGHAWCMTAWKLQGDEADGVVVCLPSPWQATCELLYTAVTRAQKQVHVFISEWTLKLCLKTSARLSRVTRLRERLVEAAAKQRAVVAKKRKAAAAQYSDSDSDDDVPLAQRGVPGGSGGGGGAASSSSSSSRAPPPVVKGVLVG